MVEALKDCGIELKEDEKVENAEEVEAVESDTKSASNIDEEKTVVKDEPVANDTMEQSRQAVDKEMLGAITLIP